MTADALIAELQAEKLPLLRNCREGECSTYGFGLCQNCREAEKFVKWIDAVKVLDRQWLEMREWKNAVIDAMVVCDMYPREHETARSALNRLICYEQDIALDPRVSSDAAKLVAFTRTNTIEECKQAILSLFEVKDKNDQRPNTSVAL